MGPMRNKYVVGTHISERKFRDVVKFFCDDYIAAKTAEFTGISRPTINKYYNEFRKVIAELCDEPEKAALCVTQELKRHSLFRSKLKTVLGWGGTSDISILGLLKNDGTVYTQITDMCAVPSWASEIVQVLYEEGDMISESYEEFKREVMSHWERQRNRIQNCDSYRCGKEAVKEIESFWQLCRVRLARFRGLKKDSYYLHIKECEFRYNMRNADMYQALLKAMRERPIELS